MAIKILLTGLGFFLTILNAVCQVLSPSVVSASGGYITINNPTSISYTIGEINITSLNTNGIILNQGFQQPEMNLITGSLTSNSFCAGDSLQISYNAQGYFGTTNMFYVQLSDTSGNFTSSKIIGNINSQASGIINCILPFTLTTGIAYRIRVVSNVPSIQGKDNNSNIIITALPTPVIVASDATIFCAGNNITLSSSSGSSYLWSTGETSQNITVSTSGNYHVTTTNSGGCKATSPQTVVLVNPLPIANISTLDSLSNLCPGKTETLTSNFFTSYLWNTGANTQSIVVNSTGNYSVTVTNENGCTANSDTTIVTYQSCGKPKTVGSSNIKTTKVKLKWKTVGCAISYQIQYRIGISGTFTTINTSSADTTYTLTGLLPATAYQWKVAAICQNNPLVISVYSKLVDFTTTASVVVVQKNATIIANTGIQLYPNPVKDKLTIELNCETVIKANIIITGMDGKTVQQLTTTLQSGNNKITMPVAGLASGSYLLRININNGQQVMKFVKE